MSPSHPSVTRSFGHDRVLFQNAGKVPNDVTLSYLHVNFGTSSWSSYTCPVINFIDTSIQNNRWFNQRSTAVNLFVPVVCLQTSKSVSDTSVVGLNQCGHWPVSRHLNFYFSISISIWPLTKKWKEKSMHTIRGERIRCWEYKFCTVTREHNAFPAIAAWPVI